MTGIFDAIGTPQERQERVLRTALELRRDQWPHEGFVFQGAADLLLQHGQFYSGRVLPPEYHHLKGQMGRCFENAMDACEADPTLRYVEGVYAIGTRHYTPHAWCLDPDGKLLEVSLFTQPDEIANGVEGQTGLPVMPVDRWGYWGVILHPDLVQAVWATQDGVGCLDRPVADAADGHPEWREDWPLLHLPYDPNRRTL